MVHQARQIRSWSSILPTIVAACAFPSEQFDARAGELGLQRKTVQGAGFTHVVFVNRMVEAPASVERPLHIYIGGDGSPMLGDFPNPDPTPRQPLALHLTALDPNPAVYLGRPCYHGESAAAECSPALWTTGRYSETVVASLVTAAHHLIDDYGFRSLSLFGYSGGGTLAALMSPRMPEVVELVTVAAVLDTEAWARERQIVLDTSLNPVEIGRVTSPALTQHHYAGAADRVVPRSLAARAAQRLKVPLTIVDQFGHTCCWEEKWPTILAGLESR